jgi:hypothetical protein
MNKVILLHMRAIWLGQQLTLKTCLVHKVWERGCRRSCTLVIVGVGVPWLLCLGDFEQVMIWVPLVRNASTWGINQVSDTLETLLVGRGRTHAYWSIFSLMSHCTVKHLLFLFQVLLWALSLALDLLESLLKDPSLPLYLWADSSHLSKRLRARLRLG